jgi:large subunit ribosomal protein L18
MADRKELLQRRRYRTRLNLKKLAKIEKPRLSVFRSNFHIYAQLIDDQKGVTLASASSLDKDLKGQVKKGWDVEAAELVGKVVAEKAQKIGVKAVLFDRGPYVYHGRIKALAMGARAGGLEF